MDALYSALLSGKVAGFAGDVFFHEPPDSSHPLIQAYINGEEWLEGRFLLTPHAAFYAKETQLEMREKAALNILNFLHYRSLKNCVNKEYLQNLRHP